MRELEIVFTKSRKNLPIASWAIRWWTKKEYSHVACCRTMFKEIDLFYQASEGKVNYEHTSVFNEKHEIVKSYKILVPKEIYYDIGKAFMLNAGKPYGLKQNVGIMYCDIMASFGKYIDNPWPGGQNCSELIERTVLKKMIPGLNKDPDKVKPHEIELMILKHFKKDENGCYTL